MNPEIDIYEIPEFEDSNIWWNKKFKMINVGNNKVLRIRTEINLRLLSDPYIKKITLNIVKELFIIINCLKDTITKYGCEITNKYIVKKINNGMKPHIVGSFLINESDINDFDNFLDKLNSRELNQLYYASIECKQKNNETNLKEPAIFINLLIKLQELFNIKHIKLYDIEKVKYAVFDIKNNNKLIKFLDKINKINSIKKRKVINKNEPFCVNSNVCTKKFFQPASTPLIEQLPVTVTYKNMEDHGIPLSDREKTMTKYEGDPNKNIGWYPGISADYILSGKLVELAQKNNYDIVAGLSGTILRNLLIFCCLDLNINESFLSNLINLTGAFHHSTFECILTGLHFNKFLIENDLKDTFCKFDINHDFLNYIKYIEENIYHKLHKTTKVKIEEIIKKYKKKED